MPVAAATLACPACGVPLRLRLPGSGATEAPCPDCGRPLRFEAADGTATVAVAPIRPEVARTDPGGPQRARGSRTGQQLAGRESSPKAATLAALGYDCVLASAKSAGASAADVLGRPLVLAWLIAGTATAALTAAFVAAEREYPPPRPARPIAIRLDGPPPASPAEVKTAPAAEVDRGDTDLGTSAVAVAPPPTESPAPVEAPRPTPETPVDPRIAVAAALDQRVARFVQPTPIPFDRLRLQIEELAGVPLRIDDDAAARDAEITLDLRDARLADVLAEACRRAGLVYAVEPDGVHISAAVPP